MKTGLKVAMWGLLLAVLAVAIVLVGVKQNVLDRLRVENEALLKDREEAQRLMVANERLAQLRKENAEVVTLRAENQDLPRLRNEVRQLRRETKESVELSEENERLRAKINAGQAGTHTLPADFVKRAAMVDSGFNTPEAAIQTILWAMCRGDFERLSQGSVNGVEEWAEKSEEQRKDMTEELSNTWKDFPGFYLAGKKIISADDVEMDVETSAGGEPFPMKLRKVGGQWKLLNLVHE